MDANQSREISILEIDLNLDITQFGNEDVDGQLEEAPINPSNCDTHHAHPILDLNNSPNSPISLDLNEEPRTEDDTNVEVQPISHQSEFIIGENFGDATVEQSKEQNQTKKHRTLSNVERKAIYDALLQKSVDGKLKNGMTTIVASLFSVPIRTVQRIWKQSKDNGMNGDVSHKRTRNCGRKRIQIDLDRFREIPLHQRTTFESLAFSMDMSRATLCRLRQEGSIRRHSNAMKPFLKEENKRSRLRFCISMLDPSSIPHDPTFIGMYNTIHIDEKWFYMTKKSECYYLLPDEDDPIRTCQSKNFIVKVMFLVALARPRFDAQGNEIFNGKIGVFPFVTQEPAKRTSANRVAGTLETKPITSVNREVIKSFLIEKLLPAIKTKWPREDSQYPIFIQQDNARTHIDRSDPEFCRAATQDGFNIRLMSQPANSPDLNVLDLGFFNGIQSLQYKESPKTVDDLVIAVIKSFDAFPTMKSNRIFLTLQLCMIEIMKAKGSQKYKIPHINKAMLERTGELPTRMKCDAKLLEEVNNYLSAQV